MTQREFNKTLTQAWDDGQILAAFPPFRGSEIMRHRWSKKTGVASYGRRYKGSYYVHFSQGDAFMASEYERRTITGNKGE